PVEARSIFIAVTEGCTWGRCRFCGVYSGIKTIQEYRVRPWESIKKDIDLGLAYHGTHVKSVFLAGGNALSAPTELLLKTLRHLNEKFQKLERISSYAKNHDILRKKRNELVNLACNGLSIVYMGLESGSDNVLKYMNKGTTAKGMIRATKKLKGTGIKLSVYVILGLGGNLFQDHAIETAKVITAMKPDVIRFRTLNFIPNAPLYQDWMNGKFIPLRPAEILEEEAFILENIPDEVEAEVFNDHVSNPVYIDGKIPRDKQSMIKLLKKMANNPYFKSREHENRTMM
ncbi:MAG: radical SAM protein, partial [Promethearchaeota archaeon]